jgi:hypothetical protein
MSMGPIEFKLYKQGNIWIKGKKKHRNNLWLTGLCIFPHYVNSTVKMLNWTYASFLKDAEQVRKNMVQASSEEEKLLHLFEEDFTTGSLSRIFSYVNLVYVLEGFLKKAYSDLVEVVVQCSSVATDKPAFLAKRKAELKVLIEQYRHKITAHTSYSAPRSDSFAVQMASLVIPGSFTCSGFDPARLTLNGSGQFWGEDTGITSLALSDEHSKMVEHFREWDMEFARLLGAIRNVCPFSNSTCDITVSENGFSNVQIYGTTERVDAPDAE